MAATATSASTHYFFEAKPRWTGTIGSGGVADAVTTTIPLSSVTNLDSGDAYIVVINRVDANGTKNALSEMETTIGELSGTNLINCVRGVEGTASGWDAGTVVEILMTATHWNKMIAGIGVSHDADGGHATDAIDAITEIASALKSGSDTTLVTGTAGTTDYTAKWNGDGDLVDGYAVLDEDNMSSDSATSLATQQSIKAYVDASGSTDGWTAYSAVVPTRTTDNDPEFVISFASTDLSSTLYPGMRMKFTQNSTVRYFIVTKVAYSTNTDVTLFGGTDYNVDDTGTYTISALSYSHAKVPAGFDPDPSIWTVSVTDTSNRTQSSPAAGTWYNLGTVSIDIPTGLWDVGYTVRAYTDRGSDGNANINVTLSTANNTESDGEFTSRFQVTNVDTVLQHFYRSKLLELTAEDTYYFNTMTDIDTSGGTIGNQNASHTLRVKAVCSYL